MSPMDCDPPFSYRITAAVVLYDSYIKIIDIAQIKRVTPSGGVFDFNFLQHMAENGHILCSSFAVYVPIATCNIPIDPA